MMLVHPYINREMNFTENSFWLLILENNKQFYELNKCLINQINDGLEGAFVLSKDFKVLDIAKFTTIIYNFYDLTCNEKKTITIFHKMLVDLLNYGDYLSELNNINNKMLELNKKLLQEIEFNVECNTEFSTANLVKFMDYKFKNSENLIDMFLEYIDICIKLKNTKLFIFVDISSYFTNEELNTIFKQLKYLDIYVLCVENKKNYDFESFSTIIIDKDLCEI